MFKKEDAERYIEISKFDLEQAELSLEMSIAKLEDDIQPINLEDIIKYKKKVVQEIEQRINHFLKYTR